MTLTRKQKQFLDFIQSFIREQGYSPSNQEIANGLGFKSKGTVSDYLDRLRGHGYLNSEGIFDPSSMQRGNQLPLLGKVAAGKPLEFFSHEEFLEVPSSFLKKGKKHFVLQVQGDSMLDEAICDGDYVIVRKQRSADNGQVVVATVDGGATLKKFYKKRNQVELQPANSRYDKIVVRAPEEFQVEGVLAGVLRLMGFP